MGKFTNYDATNVKNTGKNKPETPLSTWAQYCLPWERIHIDYSEPADNQSMRLVISDAGTKWIDMYSEVDDFCQVKGIHQVKTGPSHSWSKGLVQRAIRTIKNK
ncbi:hypothetical protein RF11_10454 [Thelohanellus kitauei]|uniref:Integrase catalytic domain-containing protein n=1 Tax=Thelohanellus kitauei TaxID=669202 RepID=A0A0C2NFP0_THEKT|nr:hypothetical protein RF11_10454 [Thelohanellus kitauei]